MADWPGNPVANMGVDNFQGGTDSWISASPTVATQQTVSDIHVTFTIGIEYHDHPYFDHGRGSFSARLKKLTTSGWQQLDQQSKLLGTGNSGDWFDTLSVSVTMVDPIEQYQLVLHDEWQDTFLGTSADLTLYYQAVQGQAAVGDFTLDFVPLTIVYCPPGQDMTNFLSQTESFGTRFTISEATGFESDTNVSLKIDFLGIIGEGIGFSNSQSVSNQSTSGIQVSHFRNTTVTADNQRAIGRAYWGPLNDIFAIMVNPNFAVSRRADGTMFYCANAIQQVLLIPARKLLRPDGDPIAGQIPADARQRLLELDPFITNLNLFFPDSGADLAQAANPFADPSTNNRAELIGRWWLDGGTELNYAVGETVQLLMTQTNEVKYGSGVSINASAGVNYDGIAAALGLSADNKTWVGMQSSKENDGGFAKNASCFLIHNQNERDLDGIELYFDKIFSTFMFRRVNARELGGGGPGGTGTTGTAATGSSGTTGTAGTAGTAPPPPGTMRKLTPPRPGSRGFLVGRVTNWEGKLLRGLQVYLTGPDGSQHQTSTRITGQYSFANLAAGDYTLVAGDQRRKVTIGADSSPFKPVRSDVTDVRRVLDLRTAPIWEVTEALGLPSDAVRKIGSQLKQIKHEDHVATIVGADAALVARWRRAVVFAWPGLPGGPAQTTPPDSKGPKPPDRGRESDRRDQRKRRK